MRKQRVVVLVNTKPFEEKKVGYDLKKIAEASGVYQLDNEGYKYLVELDVNGMDHLNKVLRRKIRDMPDVIDTKTIYWI